MAVQNQNQIDFFLFLFPVLAKSSIISEDNRPVIFEDFRSTNGKYLVHNLTAISETVHGLDSPHYNLPSNVTGEVSITFNVMQCCRYPLILYSMHKELLEESSANWSYLTALFSQINARQWKEGDEK